MLSIICDRSHERCGLWSTKTFTKNTLWLGIHVQLKQAVFFVIFSNFRIDIQCLDVG